MLRGVLLVGALVIGSILLLHSVLANGSILQYLDAHPDPRWVPATEYVLGQTYYLFQDLPNAATYFIRIPERYPKSSQADDAYFNYLQCLDDTPGISRDSLIGEYQKYLDTYPASAHAAVIKDRVDALRNGSR
jgi:outer membrane protein assembly factor BamD (BamD/ComL family)